MAVPGTMEMTMLTHFAAAVPLQTVGLNKLSVDGVLVKRHAKVDGFKVEVG